ncbi:hypothetical protein D3C80_824430 [compost metagenome]
MAGSKAAGSEHGAAKAHGGDTQGIAQQAFHLFQIGLRPGQFRHAGRHRAENRHAEAVEAKQPDHQGCHCHGHQRRRQARVAARQPDQQTQPGDADHQGQPVDFFQALQQVDQAEDEAVAFDLESHHLAQLPGQQAQANTVEVADENGPREKTGNKPGPRQPGTDQHQTDQDGDNHRQLRQPRRVAHGQRCNGPGDHGAGGGIRADHQLPRTADQGIDHHRQDARIQAVLRRQPDDLRIGNGDRNLDRRHRQTGLQVMAKPFAAVLQQIGQAWQPAGEKHARILSSVSRWAIKAQCVVPGQGVKSKTPLLSLVQAVENAGRLQGH